MPGMDWAALLNSPQPTSAGAALANSATLTDVSALPNWVLPANFCQNGSAFRLTARGVFSTTGTPTLTLGFYFGGVAGVALAASNAITTATTLTNVQFEIEATMTVRSTGTTGTAWTQGRVLLGTSATAFAVSPLPGAAPSAVTIDTTAAKAITVGAQWGTASASNTLTCHQFYFESVGY